MASVWASRAVRHRGLHQTPILKNVVFAVEDGVNDGNKPCLDGFLVQMRRFAFVFTLELVIALPDDPAVFWGRVPDLRAEEGTAVAAYDAG